MSLALKLLASECLFVCVCRVLLRMSESTVQTVGETLLILALLYFLIQIAQGALKIQLFPEW